MRRPSPALFVALLALFVALGGPAQAKKVLIGSKQIKDKSIARKDLRPSLVRQLTATADNSVTGAKIADGSVTAADLAKDAVPANKIDDNAVTTAKLADGAVESAKLGANAVTEAKIADNSVTGKAIRNGTLDAKDIGGFAGSVAITLTTQGACSVGSSSSLTSLVAGQDLSNDAIVATPPATFPDTVTVTARAATADSIHIAVCGTGAPTGEVTFRYVTIDVSA